MGVSKNHRILYQTFPGGINCNFFVFFPAGTVPYVQGTIEKEANGIKVAAGMLTKMLLRAGKKVRLGRINENAMLLDGTRQEKLRLSARNVFIALLGDVITEDDVAVIDKTAAMIGWDALRTVGGG
jgi:hypothetical protein